MNAVFGMIPSWKLPSFPYYWINITSVPADATPRNLRTNEKNVGSGFKKSTLYYMPDPHILQRENFVDMKVPEWLLNTMCAVWNSGIGVIYAKDKIGDNNYRNADVHGRNSSYLLKYLPKLVNR